MFDYGDKRMNEVMTESKSETVVRMNKEANKMIEKYSIDLCELMYQTDLAQSVASKPYLKYTADYSTLTNKDINSMSTYNALRYLYRKAYDLRSEGMRDINNPDEFIGREIHPISKQRMNVNYINDFSMSPQFNPYRHNNFVDNITSILPQSAFPFDGEGYYKNFIEKRATSFFECELKIDRDDTHDFFSTKAQVNPLLYAYTVNEDGELHTMDADFFLEKGYYPSFSNESYTMRGNQCGIKLWQIVTDLSCKRVPIYYEDGTESYSYKYTNPLLFDDSYTEEYMNLLQNGSKFFTFDRKNENDTAARGFLFYDVLLDVLFKYMNGIMADDNDSLKLVNSMHRLFSNSIVRDEFELNGIPIDQCCSLNSYKPTNELNAQCLDDVKNRVGEYVMASYRYNYNVVFGQLFRLLKFILAPTYHYDVESPAMNILFTAFTIIGIKEMHAANIDDYNKIIERLVEVCSNLNNPQVLNKNTVCEQFKNVFGDIISKYTAKHIERIAKLLVKNTAAQNYNAENTDKVDTYFSDQYYCFIDNKKDDGIADNIDTTSRAMILLTEFFKKMDNIRYFDASTFCVDCTLLESDDMKDSVRLFSDSLLEACYISLNTLGSEVFFNGRAPGHLISSNISHLCKDTFYREVVGLDTTRVAKQNVSLFNNTRDEKEFQKQNPFNSYIPVINIYTSLAYCMRISLDNITTNPYHLGEYNNTNLRRPVSLWTITKRYAMHLTYMNHNQYGIYNNVELSSGLTETNQKIMVAHRLKWLMYGLHTRVWYNDNYLFYSNYKKLMGEIHDAVKVLTRVNELYGTAPLFSKVRPNIQIALPNIGLALSPMAGSYTIMTAANCFKQYMNGCSYLDRYMVQLIHHGLKDIMVGDSMSSVVGERMECIRTLLENSEFVSFNNINGRMERQYSTFNPIYFEVAMSNNIDYLFRLVIAPHFFNNKNDILVLNSVNSNSTYDESTFDPKNIPVCGYGFVFNSSWCSRVLKRALNSNDKNACFTLISKLITIHRLTVANYNNSHRKDDIISRYYKKFNAFSLMNAQLFKDYQNGISKILDRNNGVFKEIANLIFSGSNEYRIGNVLSFGNMFVGFEDNVACKCCGVPLYAMYESPMMMLIYNNLDFDLGFLPPTEADLYKIVKYLFTRVHSTMKRMIVDLNFNGKPLGRIVDLQDNCPLKQAKQIFVYDTLDYSNMLVDHKFIENSIFSKIDALGGVYKFAASIGQFMDYDFLASQIVHVLDNQYDANSDCVKFIQSMVDNRKEELSRYYSYCDILDFAPTQLNSIITNIIKNKCGSKRVAESSKIIRPDHDLDQYMSFFTEHIDPNEERVVPTKNISRYITMNALGVTEEQYERMTRMEKQEYDEQVAAAKELDIKEEREFLDKVSSLERERQQLVRAHKLNKNDEEYNNKLDETITSGSKEVEKEYLTLLAKEGMEETMLKYLATLTKNTERMCDMLSDISLQLRELNGRIDSCTIEKNKDDDEEQDEASDQGDGTGRNHEEDVDGISDSSSISDGSCSCTGSIYNPRTNCDSEIVEPSIEEKDASCGSSFIEPMQNGDGSITFFSPDNTKFTVQRDLEPAGDISELRVDLNEQKFFGCSADNGTELSEEETELPDCRVSYDKYLYIPRKFLLNVIPDNGYKTDTNLQKKYNVQKSQRRFSKVSSYKILKQNVPIFVIDYNNLVLPFDNIPISFNQKSSNIELDVMERLAPTNPLLADHIVSKMRAMSKLFEKYDGPMSHKNRAYFIQSFYNQVISEPKRDSLEFTGGGV